MIPTPTGTPTAEVALTEEVPTPEASPTATADSYSNARKKMVRDTMRLRDITDEEVLAVMEKVPRHEFVPAEYLAQAYADHPLPIGYGQTISQPYIVAYMTELLRPKQEHKVLEVGTGSGYQAAVFAEIVSNVYTIEIIEELGKSAKERLANLEYKNIEAKIADGYYGWEEHAPFDAIIVTCAANHVPPPLVEQLKPGGQMCIPVGTVFGPQQLVIVTKQEDGKVRAKSVLPVRFVPLVGGHSKATRSD
ncbi:MAG: protein-L-isoaspartate(D-aspartate) O-methyltransferase [Candidatus Hydrogenedentes bacterium]|nr:protein-L-isoaspartate(D-aspartate) O-methyltransferase [Candidatus Hydrogenedentota bacterium]